MTSTNNSPLSAGQLHILEMLARCSSPESLSALKKALCDFYANEAQKEADRLWDEGIISEQTIEEWKNEHMRTPYTHS